MKRVAKICRTCPNMGQYSYYNPEEQMMVTENTHKAWTGCNKGKKPSNCDYEDLVVEA